ncbi:MAG: hypothetical protein IJ012_07945 [Clostridia bacterium]|nr:hypothetical protein [Clostridia bacterium]
MSIVKRNEWKKALDARAEEKRRKEFEENHPLAAMKENDTPKNVLASHQTVDEEKGPALSEDTGMGGGKREDAFTIPSDTQKEAADTRAELGTQANEYTEAGRAEREAANEKGDTLYDLILDFAAKQDGRYDELLSLVKADDYAGNETAREIFYEYLKNGEIAATDTGASLAGENGGNVDSYSIAMAGHTKNEYGAAGDTAAREYYSEYLDRILRVLQASGGDMNDLYGTMQDNVDTVHKAADTDLSIGSDLLQALADAQTAERKIEADGFAEMTDRGNTTGTYEISPMRLDEEYNTLITKEGSGGGYTETEALMLLWDKYPSMRSYLMEKYIKLQNKYVFIE